MSGDGHIELERRIDSITVGERSRRELGDLTPLTESLDRVGLLQPVTITPDGLLVCGFRRLEAAKRLGWDTVRVWVRSGISDDLTRLLAGRDDNATHKPLSATEAAKLYDELLALTKEDAARRKQATQYHPESGETAGHSGHADSAGPEVGSLGTARRQASERVTGKASYARLEQICEMERIAADTGQPDRVRTVAEDELEAIRNGGAVDPSYQRLKAAARAATTTPPPEESDDFDSLAREALAQAKADRARRVKENRQKRAAAAEHARRSVRSFVLTWAELDGWSKHYDAEQVARELKEDDWALFLRVLDETKAFADAVSLARSHPPT